MEQPTLRNIEAMTMKFRKLYWVTESLCEEGSSVNGVYTSFVDLMGKGLANGPCPIRLSLFTLDTPGHGLGTWDANNAAQIVTDLQPFVESGEFTVEDCRNLQEAFTNTALAPA